MFVFPQVILDLVENVFEIKREISAFTGDILEEMTKS